MRERSDHGVTLVIPLLILLVGLKLAEVVDWSWWLVTAPAWIPPFLFLYWQDLP